MNAVTQIAAALLNTFWQAVLLAFLVWLALRLAGPRSNAATRHLIWWIALAAIAILPALPRHLGREPAAPPRPVVRHAQSVPMRLSAPLAPPAPAPITFTQRRAAWWPYGLFAVWAAAFAARAFRVARSYFHLRGVKRRATIDSRALPALPRPARLLISSEIPSPIAVGFLDPAVILPERCGEQWSGPEMECVLLHEAAHLARYDDWTNLCAHAVAAALALHPVAWWILRRIEREREMAADDWVVARTGAARRYAESLARIVEWRIRPLESPLAAGIFARRSRLLERIESLLRRGREFSPSAAQRPVAAALAALAILAAAGALAPHWIAFAQRLEFEVASVKISAANQEFGFIPRRSGDRVSLHMSHIGTVILYAYRIPYYRLIGYEQTPIAYEWYDIDAKIGRDNATEDEVRLMFQSLLEDRFQLRVHREQREMPEYQLTLAKGKPRLTPASNDDAMKTEIEGRHLSTPKGICSTTLWTDGARLTCHAVTGDQIASATTGEFQGPVANQTGLTGTYDLNLRFVSDRGKPRVDAEPGPSLAAALESEVGIKVEKGKGPVEVLVIDRIQKPSQN